MCYRDGQGNRVLLEASAADARYAATRERVKMLRGTGSAPTNVPPATVIAYLADPRHAARWFGNVTAEGLVDTVPRSGLTWRFAGNDPPSPRSDATRSGRHQSRQMRMAAYVPGRGFAWESALGRWRTNIRWEVTCSPAADVGNIITLDVRWRPSPLGWILVALAALLAPMTLARRAQRTAERAAAAVEEAGAWRTNPVDQATSGGERRSGAKPRAGRRPRRH
jgi:hypothetical protein